MKKAMLILAAAVFVMFGCLADDETKDSGLCHDSIKAAEISCGETTIPLPVQWDHDYVIYCMDGETVVTGPIEMEGCSCVDVDEKLNIVNCGIMRSYPFKSGDTVEEIFK